MIDIIKKMEEEYHRIYSKGLYAYYKEFYQHFIDSGFEFLFEFNKEKLVNEIKLTTLYKVLFNEKYSIICCISFLLQEWETNEERAYVFNSCNLYFEVERKMINVSYDKNSRPYRLWKKSIGYTNAFEFDPCYICYDWRPDCYSEGPFEIGEIIHYFEKEEDCKFKNIWVSNKHNAELELGLFHLPNGKNLISEFLDKIQNQNIKKFLKNCYLK